MSHWYKADGEPCHWIEGKNGKMRDTTLRDARKLNLRPSVTEILNMAAKPALTNWLINQAILSCLTLPKIEGETLDSFKARAEQDSKAQAEEARDLGSAIHADIEEFYKGANPLTLTHGHKAIRVHEEIVKYTGLSEGWISEAHFANKDYGGMVDLHHPDGWVIDFKTKDFADPKKKMAYDEHCMQLSAYAHGLEMPEAKKLNMFISTTQDLIVIHEWEEDYYERFECLLKYWQLTKKYKPEES